MTLARVTARQRWILPAAAILFVALGIGAAIGVLIWDEPITRWLVDARSDGLNDVFLQLSFLGSTKVVILVSAIAALLAARRCPRLALAIVVIALARPATEFLLKEVVSRPRPVGDRLVGGEGYSFPSGHPLAAAASWGTLPLVAALYTKRRTLWWLTAIAVWTIVALVAMSRVGSACTGRPMSSPPSRSRSSVSRSRNGTSFARSASARRRRTLLQRT